MKRFLVALLLALLPAATLGAAAQAPVVVVYPLTVAGPKSEAGATIATLLSTKLASLGDLSVKPYTPGTERPQYLEAAIGIGADYYITGFLTPVGSEVSLIAQVVSTHSGSIVYSATSLVKTYADTLSQADLLREAILRHAGRGFAALERPAPEPSLTPAPTIANGGVNLSKALGRKKRGAVSSPVPETSSEAVAALPLAAASGGPPSIPSAGPTATAPVRPPSGRRKSARARPGSTSVVTRMPALTPSAAPASGSMPTAGSSSVAAAPASSGPGSAIPASSTPAVAASAFPVGAQAPSTIAKGAVAARPGPALAALVVEVGGDAETTARSRATSALSTALRRNGIAGGILAISGGDVRANAGALCAANAGSRAFYAGTLAVETREGGTTVALDVAVYDCTAMLLGERHASVVATRGGIDAAIDRAASQAAAAVAKIAVPARPPA